MDEVFAVILVGGKGKRLRPLSTDSRPKAFLSVTRDRKTMFRKTIDRIKKIVPQDDILVVANKRHLKLVRKDFPAIAKGNLMSEPLSRNTAPAIVLAAFVLQRRSDDPLMVVVPTDQYVINEREYLKCLKRGIRFVTDNKDVLIVIGAKPRYPATGFGYIKTAGRPSASCLDIARHRSRHREPVERLGTGRPKTPDIYKVERFTEKPNLELAKKYLKDKRYLWNAGAFIFRTSSLLRAARRFAPRIFEGLRDLTDIDRSYEKLPDISIDYTIMEKADNIYCVKASYEWQDMGSFDAIKTILKRERRRFVLKGDKIIKIR